MGGSTRFQEGIYAALFAVGTFYLIFFGAILLLVLLKFMGDHCVSAGISNPHHLPDSAEDPRDTIHHSQQNRASRRTSFIGANFTRSSHHHHHHSSGTGGGGGGGASSSSFQLGAIRIK